MKKQFKVLAKQYFRGVYGGEPSVVDELAGDEIVMSYPIFERLFDTPVIRGREGVRAFVVRFSNRWHNVQIAFHEVLAEGDNVVLVWRFEGRNVGQTQQDEEPTNEVHSWGGITLLRFNRMGKIVVEIGEESSPGPIERLAMNGT